MTTEELILIGNLKITNDKKHADAERPR